MRCVSRPRTRARNSNPTAASRNTGCCNGASATRNVIVTPAAYVDDNSVTLDALQRLGANARGVALLTTAVTDAELKRLTDGGVRGVRLSQNPLTVTSTFDMIEPLAKRVMPFGWHVQIYMPPDRIAAAEDV
jgi:D-galactarolactone isomerase